jgi:ATP-dependent Lhr-like helicase
MVKLMLSGWFEPPLTNGVHASTLVQQLLSIIAERGGVNAASAWGVLIASGPFKTFTKDDFTSLLRHMGEKKLIMQETGTGLLLLGELGEKLVNHYEFYCSFESEEEYRVECNGKVLGSLPIDRPLSINEGIMFAGRRWRVIDIDPQAKRIQVIADKGGSNSSFFGEGGLVIHDKIRATVKELLEANEDIKFLDSTAQNILSEARSYFQALKFDSDFLLPVGREVILCSWLGDRINRTIALYFKIHGIEAEAVGVSINIKSNVNDVKKTIAEIVRFGHYPIAVLLQPFKDLNCGKWSWAIPREINEKSFSSLYLDQAGALAFLGTPCFKNIEE